MTPSDRGAAARVLLQSIVLARHRRHRPAADRAGRRSRRRCTASRSRSSPGIPLGGRRRGACATRLRNGVRIIRARGTTLSPRPLRRAGAQLPHLFPVGAVGGAAAASAGRHRGADRSADHRSGGARRAAAPRHGVLLPGHFSRGRRPARGLSTARSSTRCSSGSTGSWSGAPRASSRSATRWRHG